MAASWWVATYGARSDVYQAATAFTAQARHPTWTVAGPFASRAAAQSFAGGGSPAAPPGGSSAGASSACGPKAIYLELTSQGFSTVQAIGVMANGIAESGLRPETRVMDSNGRYSNGIWQFNEASYPNSGSLVTGNCAADIRSQVGFLKSVVSGSALAGSTGAEVAGNFAANFERCQGCQQGSNGRNGWSTRVAHAATVEGWVSSGNWPAGGAGVTGAGGGSSATLAASGSRCLIGGGTLVPCFLSASEARGMIGGLCIAAGGLIGAVGLVVIVAFGLQRSNAAGAAAGIAAVVPGGQGLAAGLGAVQARASRPPRARGGNGGVTP
jgi:hypothetical protein